MNFKFVLSLVAISVSIIFQASLGATIDSSDVLRQIDEREFYSQANQDKFVYSLLYGLLDKQDKGYYLEIGASEPIYINNSYFFEKNVQWDGVSIDISDQFVELWQATRKNLLLSEDATRSNYTSILKNFPRVIDYLSLDVDGYYDVVLEKVINSDHVFKVITIEHDFYRFGDAYRQKERTILTELGYYMLCSDVSNEGNAFEDWWIHPDFFPASVFSKLTTLDLRALDYTEIMPLIRNLIFERN